MTDLITKTATLETVRGVLDSLSVRYQLLDPPGWLTFQEGPIKASMRVDQVQRSPHFQSFWHLDPAAEPGVVFDAVNRVNGSLPMLRAVADLQEGSLAFVYALRLYGGLTPETIVATLDRFIQLVDQAMAEVAVPAGVVLTRKAPTP